MGAFKKKLTEVANENGAEVAKEAHVGNQDRKNRTRKQRRGPSRDLVWAEADKTVSQNLTEINGVA